ncbi:MAG: TIM barrel protein, partial [Planctomycetota bacterium]
MKRRRALGIVAGVCSAGLIRPVLGNWPAVARPAADEPWIKKTLKIGMIGIPGTLEQRLRGAKDAGFDGVEVDVPLAGMTVAEVAKAAESAGIKIDGSVGRTHWQIRHSDPDESVRKQALDNLILGLKQTAELGGDSCLLVVGHGKDG